MKSRMSFLRYNLHVPIITRCLSINGFAIYSIRFTTILPQQRSASISSSFRASRKKTNSSYLCSPFSSDLMKKVPIGETISTPNAEFTRTGKTGRTTIPCLCSNMPTRKEGSILAADRGPTNLMKNAIPILVTELRHSVTYHPGSFGKLTMPVLLFPLVCFGSILFIFEDVRIVLGNEQFLFVVIVAGGVCVVACFTPLAPIVLTSAAIAGGTSAGYGGFR